VVLDQFIGIIYVIQKEETEERFQDRLVKLRAATEPNKAIQSSAWILLSILRAQGTSANLQDPTEMHMSGGGNA
jgi:hypothetical protein